MRSAIVRTISYERKAHHASVDLMASPRGFEPDYIRIGSYFGSTSSFEPGGQEFESLRARSNQRQRCTSYVP
jgi:hypothetical protein